MDITFGDFKNINPGVAKKNYDSLNIHKRIESNYSNLMFHNNFL